MANRIEVQAHGPVAVGALTWRYRGQPRVTAVVKAWFDRTGASGSARSLWPVHGARVGGWGTDGLLDWRDWAPYRPGVDVIVTGNSVSAGEDPIRAFAVGLRIVRGGLPVLDKRLSAVGLAGSVDWPARARLLGSLDPASLGCEPIALPDDFDWRFFHVAPEDQRLGALHGDELILLDGLRAAGPLQLTMPVARVAATLVGQDGRPIGAPFRLVADTLEIDADRAATALVWRGSVDFVGDETRLGVHAWLEPLPVAPRAEAAASDAAPAGPRVRPPPPPVRSKPSRHADPDEVTLVTRPRPHDEGTSGSAGDEGIPPLRPDATSAPSGALDHERDDGERAPDSSRTRPMLPIDHLLAIGRQAVPYRESVADRPHEPREPGGRGPVVDAGAWVAERLPRGAAAPVVQLAIQKTGPTLDDAPLANGPLPPIIMPAPEHRAVSPEPYDDEVTSLRPLRLPDRTPMPEPSDPVPVDSPARPGPKG